MSALGGTAAAAVIILVFAQVGGLRGDTYRLYAVASDARGIIKGTEVWLAGQQVGIVSGITLLPISARGPGRVLLELDVLTKHRSAIRDDSRVGIRSGGSLIGAPVVSVSVGSQAGRVLADGDTLSGVSQGDVEALRAEVAVVSRDLLRVLDHVRAISVDVQRARDELDGSGAAEGAAALRGVRGRAQELTARVTMDSGTLGRLARDRELRERARRLMAQADSMKGLLVPESQSDGALRDSTLLRSLADAREEVASIRRLFTEASGSAGRFANDRALALQLARLERELDSTLADVKRHPRRYLPF